MTKRILLLLLSLVLISGCSSWVSGDQGSTTTSSSLVDYLYPSGDIPTYETAEKPKLTLPLSVGIAFVPPNSHSVNQLTYQQQQQLLNQVKSKFISHDFIARIELIPQSYLKKKRGFDTLEQIARLYKVDTMALISYDQLIQRHNNSASLLYLTIVGLYTIPGSQNLTQTFVETTVFDVKSRQMLMRAAGVSALKKTTTAIGIDKSINKQSYKGFELAVTDMAISLEHELEAFKLRVKEENIADIEFKSGYSGGGSFTLLFLLALITLILHRLFSLRLK
ncbi:rhombotarget lipoprotein [Vibrio sp. SS-MA-C1-2]|uniref:rhombotarget lipoprotein n=1 Tax=Vibrio sp. SS-MA-C1-2 TaxID=2908646 RepID=UPI001F22434F|nr:rhombotarget lipoprotein [Vibrio sp. SS-MA-C1-2]UJF18300.1 rhombotarget lipoprotein [Vibrio sp. SS-MA-C1-2]